METATPGTKGTRDGWLNRVLAQTTCAECEGRTLADARAHAADHATGQSAMAASPALRGIALGAALPLSLRGVAPALAIEDLDRFGVAGGRDPGLESAFARVYREAGGTLVREAADEAFEAVEILKHANPSRYRPAPGIEYPAGVFGRSLRQIAQLIKADVGVEIAFADIGGTRRRAGSRASCRAGSTSWAAGCGPCTTTSVIAWRRSSS
jgi:uncharacterized protein (DUF1501 family)